MDDYSISSLGESKNEWCAQLINTLTPAIIDGIRSIFKEALDVCETNDDKEKYLMTFQTFLSRIPKWNDTIIKNERVRIEKFTKCGYLEELITCVHVVQLKALTCVRVGQKQKKIDIDIPSADTFIHKIYINTAKNVYTNVYLFELENTPLELQKNNRQIELFVQESIMKTIRETIPVERILRAYIDETEEEDVDVKEEIIDVPIDVETDKSVKAEDKSVKAEDKSVEEVVKAEDKSVKAEDKSVKEVVKADDKSVNADVKADDGVNVNSIVKLNDIVGKKDDLVKRDNIKEISDNHDVVFQPRENIEFSNIDNVLDVSGNESKVSAPKTIERLENIALEAAKKRREEEEEDDDDDKIKIGGHIKDNNLNIEVINDKEDPLLLNDIEILS